MNYLLFASQTYSLEILRPLQDAIIEQGHKAAWFLHGLPSNLLKSSERQLNTVESVKDFNPRAVFVPGNWVPDFFPGIKVEIFHGFGIEKKGHFDIRGFFDLYCTHGPLTTHVFENLKHKHQYFSVKETGWPKIDPLFKQAPIQKKSSQTTILYAPTFSPSLSSANDLFNSIKSLSQNCDFKWIIKFHPKMSTSVIDQYQQLENDNLSLSKHHDILPLLHQADIMLSDTSSVIAEFLLLSKPVISYKNRQPGAHIINIEKTDELTEAIKTAQQLPVELNIAMKNFCNNMHPYTDGLSSYRVLEAVEEHIKNPPKKNKPLNFWRKIQVRKRLAYYHIK